LLHEYKYQIKFGCSIRSEVGVFARTMVWFC
jgi:hypothetical protein